jgi:uncharacterized RDD family membrane protein YckC
MGGNWYYAVGQERRGPIDITAMRQLLASGQVAPNTLVWSDGMANWIAAITHPDLAVAAQQQIHTLQPGYAPPGAALSYYSEVGTIIYAGFWLRFAAALLDGVIIFTAGCVVGVILGFVYVLTSGVGQGPGGAGSELALNLVSYAINIGIGWLYQALMESSPSQATLGKMACGMKVTDENGNRITFARATGRYFGEYLSALTLFIGYMMAGWTERKQALHDLLAGTLVVRK